MTTPFTSRGKDWQDSPSTNSPVYATDIEDWDRARGGFLDTGCSPCASRTSFGDLAQGAQVALASGNSRFAKMRHEVSFGSRVIKLVYGNFFTQVQAGATETNNADTVVVRAAIEYAGTRYQVTFDVQGNRAATSVTMAPGNWAIGHVELSAETTPGQPIYSLTLATPSGTRMLPPIGVSRTTYDFSYDMATPTAGAAGDPITNGSAAPAIANSANLLVFHPMALLAPGTKSTVFAVGDSIVAGAGDLDLDNNSGFSADYGGYVARGLIGVRFWRAGLYGDRHDLHKASMDKRMAAAAACEKILISLGTNDISAGQTLATIQQNMIDTWRLYREVCDDISAITIPPRTTAVGSNWGTGAQTGATGNGAGSVFVQLRAWMLDGCPIAWTYNTDGSTITFVPAATGTTFGNIIRCKVYQVPGTQSSHPMHPLSAVIDAMTVVMAADGWSWRANTTEPTTTDGIHPSISAHIYMSRLIRNALPALDNSEDPPPPSQAGTLPYPFNGWTMDPATMQVTTANVQALTTGTVFLYEIDLRAGFISTVDLYVRTAPVTTTNLTSGWVALYDKYRNRLAISAESATTFQTVGLKSINFTVPTAVPAGRYYIGILNVGTNVASIQTAIASGGNWFSLGRTTVPPYRAATADTGRTAATNMPNPVSATQTQLQNMPYLTVR